MMSAMTKIVYSKDMKPFVGRVIAYEGYLPLNFGKGVLKDYPQTSFGVLSLYPKRYGILKWKLRVFQAIEATPSSTYLGYEKEEDTPIQLHMRLATDKERDLMLEKMRSGEAELEYTDPRKRRDKIDIEQGFIKPPCTGCRSAGRDECLEWCAKNPYK